MALLTEEVTADLRSAFAQLENPVRLAVFSPRMIRAASSPDATKLELATVSQEKFA